MEISVSIQGNQVRHVIHDFGCSSFLLSESMVFFMSNCSVSCGHGTKIIMTRDCWISDISNERLCLDDIKLRKEKCVKDPCKGLYSEWTEWTSCSKTCLKSLSETSQRIRTRMCISKDPSLCDGGCDAEREVQICTEVGLCSKKGDIVS